MRTKLRDKSLVTKYASHSKTMELLRKMANYGFRHSVVEEIVIESSFIDWISTSTIKSQNNTSPFRMHLLVIKECNFSNNN